jgi:TolB-like protein
MTKDRIRGLAAALALGLLAARPTVAQVAGPVEAGLAQLAKQIVAKSQAAGKTAIAVLPFPNADGSCSVLSNFIADELIQSLFNVPDSRLQIVERAQLDIVINELRLGVSGLLNPETTKRLGNQSGVGALTVGTITVIGDTVRINARLIATDSGMAISAAAVDIPKVAAVSELLKQPVTTGPTCASPGAEASGVAPSSKPQPSAETAGVLYETGGKRGDFEDWSLTQDWKHLNGKLINDGTRHDRLPIFAPYKPDYQDYVVEAEIRAIRGGVSFGVVVRANDGDNEEGYLVGVTPKAAVICYATGECIAVKIAVKQRFNHGNDWHIYKAEVKENTITLSIDNNIMTSVIDNKFTSSGQAGLWSREFQVEVRKFKITKLEPQ